MNSSGALDFAMLDETLLLSLAAPARQRVRATLRRRGRNATRSSLCDDW
jgi:PHD/YefM family antitoxin component YafN of YafNO toxin-antitoxin module